MAGGINLRDQLAKLASPLVPGAISRMEEASLSYGTSRTPTRTSRMKGLPRWSIQLWYTVMPLTSFLLVPAIQGTIPAYMLAFASVLFVVLSRSDNGQSNIQRTRYVALAFLIAGIWLLLVCGSQLAHLISNRHDFGDMFLVNTEDTRVVFRTALFTQILYFAPCSFISLFFPFFFPQHWIPYVLWGGWFLSI